MPEFLTLLPPQQALSRWIEHLPASNPAVEWLPVTNSLGRVCASAVHAHQPLPAFDRSTVDGYAVLASDTHGASDSLPGYLNQIGEVPMGAAPGFRLISGQCALIHTGGMLPDGADAVMMIEHTQSVRAGEVEIMKAVAAGENVVRRGEDVEQGSLVLSAGKRLRPEEIGGLMALGTPEVGVARQPLIGIISTGDEVIPSDQTPAPGQVRDINSHSLGALVSSLGGIPRFYGIIPDNAQALSAAVSAGLEECDALVITAGSSASTRDLTADVVNRAGSPGVLVHGVNVRPGKPTILGVCSGKAVLGLPGNPVSALVIARLFLPALISHLLGEEHRPIASIKAVLNVNLPSQAGREDWTPVRLVKTAQGWLVEPVFYKSNLIFSLAAADGLVRTPPDANGLGAGETVDVWLLQGA